MSQWKFGLVLVVIALVTLIVTWGSAILTNWFIFGVPF